MPDKSYENTLHLLDAHINILDHTPVKHTRWHVSATTFLLQFVQAPQDDAFTVGKTISHIWQIVMRVTVTHVRFSLSTIFTIAGLNHAACILAPSSFVRPWLGVPVDGTPALLVQLYAGELWAGLGARPLGHRNPLHGITPSAKVAGFPWCAHARVRPLATCACTSMDAPGADEFSLSASLLMASVPRSHTCATSVPTRNPNPSLTLRRTFTLASERGRCIFTATLIPSTKTPG